MTKALMPYCGGKARQASWIAAELNQVEHVAYIEPFAGAASVFFTKNRAKVNVLNDYNYNITSIFKALRDEPETALCVNPCVKSVLNIALPHAALIRKIE